MIIWVLIIYTISGQSAFGFSHVFYTEKACQEVSDKANTADHILAFCVQDKAPVSKMMER